MSEKVYRTFVIILLSLLIIATSAGFYMSIQREAACITALVDADLGGLLTNYERDVYDNPSVDNIYKQIFKTGEYQFLMQVATATIIAACNP